jgi:cell division protein FtsB
MKQVILTATWLAIAAYTLLLCIWGPSGLVAMGYAQDSIDSMRQNITVLTNLNNALHDEWQILRTDPEAVVLAGRSLGYLAHDEIAVRLNLANGPRQSANTGEQILHTPGMSLSPPHAMTIATGLWLFAALTGAVLRLGRGRLPRQRNST